jgi:hypothetical protein
MKTLIWKIRYALEIRKLCGVSLLAGWDMAGSTLEMFGGDTEECTPKEAAEEERDEWIQCS